jgi:DNA-binding transcriptional LysR family regulator
LQRLISKLPPHKALIAFEAVMRLGTVTAAAKELTSTQPAISQHLKSLEGNLNTVLFVRSGRGLQPTKTAQEYYTLVEPLLLKMAEASEYLRHSQQDDRTVNIVSNCGLAHFWLLPLLPDLQSKFPDLILNVTLSDTGDIPNNNALLLSFGRLGERLTQQTLFEEQVCAVCSNEYAQQHNLGKHSTISELAEQPLIHMDEFDNRWLNWRDWLASFEYERKQLAPLVLLGNYHTVISEVKKGHGIGLGWRCLIQHLLDDGQLRQVTDATVMREKHGYFIDTKNAGGANYTLVCEYLQKIIERNPSCISDISDISI